MSSASKLVIATLLLPGLAPPVWAQEQALPEAEPRVQYRAEEQEPEVPYRWSVSAFGGNISGGTPVGTVESIFFATTFETGSDSVWGGRGSYRVWWRLGVEGEFVSGSPGVNAVLTDLSGQALTEFPFAPLDVSFVAASLRFDLADAWVRPFLLAGIAAVSAEGEAESETAAGALFGGGIEVTVFGPAFVRADVRGLRADFRALSLTRGQLVGFEEGSISTQAVWTVGAGFRF